MSLLDRIVRRLDARVRASHSGFAAAYWPARNWARGLRVSNFGSGNTIIQGGAVVQKTSITILGSQNLVEFGPGSSTTMCRLNIRASNCRIIIGEAVRAHDVYFWINESNSDIILGPKTSASECQIVTTDRNCKLTAGADCIIARGSDVRCGDGHTIIEIETGKVLNRARHITLEDHVWVTAGCKVLKDVRIGEGSIIAAGSVVIRDVPANCLAGGIPAKVLRAGVTWKREHVDRFEKSEVAPPPVQTNPK